MASMPLAEDDAASNDAGGARKGQGNGKGGASNDAGGATAADLARVAALAAGVEDGSVVPIDRDATAKFIRDSYNAAQEPRQ